MSASASLSQSQLNEVSMFQSVTNISDVDQAVKLLTNHDWNLEAAIATALAMNQSAEQSTHQSHSQSSSLSSQAIGQSSSQSTEQSTSPALSSDDSSSDREPLLRPSTHQSSSQSTNPATRAANNQANNQSFYQTINQYPFGWLLTGLFDLITSIVSLVLPTGWVTGNRPTAPTGNRRSFHQAVNQFNQRDLSSRYQHWPPFYDGTYPQSVRESKRQSKLLFIYLHNDDQACSQFIDQTLNTVDMQNFMRENFVGWCGHVNSNDGARLKATLRVTSFPFIALLAPTAGQLAILYRHSGFISIDDLIHQLLVKLEEHAGLLHAMQLNNQASTQAEQSLQDARTIRQTQDTEYEEALARDRELAVQRAKAEEEAREAARLAAEAAEKERLEREAEEARQKEEQRRKEAKLAAIGPEPEPSATASTVSVRLIDGSKVQRRFDSAAKFGQVFDWIESNPSQSLSIRRARANKVLTPGKHQVVSNFPRAVHSDPDALLSSARLGKQAVLFVEEIIEDDDDETS